MKVLFYNESNNVNLTLSTHILMKKICIGQTKMDSYLR
jgi:hypothetical protein